MRGTYSCALCADRGAGSVCLFVCREHTCHSAYLRRRDLGKDCSPDLQSRPFLTAAKMLVLRNLSEAVMLLRRKSSLSPCCSRHWEPEGCSSWECARELPQPSFQSRSTPACLGKLTQLSELTLWPLRHLLPLVLLAQVCLGYFSPSQPEYSFLLVQLYDISSPSNSYKLFLAPKMPSSSPVQNTEAGLRVITCTLSSGLESPLPSLFSVAVCLCNSSTNTFILSI